MLRVDSLETYFLFTISNKAKQITAIINNNEMFLKFSLKGLMAMIMPIKPTIVIINLNMPIFSFNKKYAKIIKKIGIVKLIKVTNTKGTSLRQEIQMEIPVNNNRPLIK
jgi:hypothetical protein